MSLHASRTRWRRVTRRLYVVTRNSPMTTMTARTIQVSTALPFLAGCSRNHDRGLRRGAGQPRTGLEQLAHGANDGVRVDAGGGEQLGGFARTRHVARREVAERRRLHDPGFRERGEHR